MVAPKLKETGREYETII